MLRNVNYTVLERKPLKREADGGVEQSTILRLDDGLEIDYCEWSWDGLHMLDIGVNAETYDKKHDIPFENYMREKGLILGDVPIDEEDYWEYTGPLDHAGQHRLQYAVTRRKNEK